MGNPFVETNSALFTHFMSTYYQLCVKWNQTTKVRWTAFYTPCVFISLSLSLPLFSLTVPLSSPSPLPFLLLLLLLFLPCINTSVLFAINLCVFTHKVHTPKK